MKKNSHEIIRVDRFGIGIGGVDKLTAHEKGILHRAVSVCLFDAKGRWLLQKRSADKYHSPHLIANSCCSHPYIHEKTHAAAQRRVTEELGIDCPLHFCSSFVYKSDVGSGLIEHEHDHLYVGFYDELPLPDPAEVSSVFFMSEEEIREKLHSSPFLFASWFPFIFREGILHKKKIESLRTAPHEIIG